MSDKTPPKWMVGFIEGICPDHLIDEVEGDFLENYVYMCRKKGEGYAKRKAFIFIILSLPKLLYQKKYNNSITLDMLRNYLKIAFRNLVKNFGFSAINISGLAIGLASCFLIALYIQFEIGYESFHENKEDIYRYIPRSESQDGNLRMQTWTPPGFAPAMADHFAEIEKFSRFSTLDDEPLMKVKDMVLSPETLALADIDFFSIFSFNLLRGEPSQVLVNPFSVVISEDIAETFFDGEDPVGKTINYDNSYELTITGVFETLPNNSHLQFSYLIPFETVGDVIERQFGFPKERFLTDLESWNYSSYFQLSKNVNPVVLEKSIDEYFTTLRKNKFNPELMSDWLQPLNEIHFSTGIKGDEANGNKNNIYIFSAIAFFILIIACFNFMNLSTAKAMNRSKEVGVRKVMGAQKSQLVYQFLGETILLTIISLVLAIILLELIVPIFNSVMGLSLTPAYLNNPLFVLVLLGIGLLTGVIAGGYPAFYLSSFEAARVLKDTAGKSGKSGLRQVLTVLQFAIAAFLIIGTFVIYEQTSFLKNKPLGFNKDRIIFLSPPLTVADQMSVFENSLRSNSAIEGVTRSNSVPGYAGSHWTYSIPEVDKSMNINTMIVDFDFIDTYNIEVLEGRGISSEYASDSSDSYIINETAARQMMLANPIGMSIQALDGHEVGEIVGVVKDFHYKPLQQAIEPLVMRYDMKNAFTWSIKFNDNNLQQNLTLVEEEWKKIAPDYPFSYSFLDDSLEKLYQSEQNTGWLISVFSVLAVFIACLGLLGLTSFLTEQRKKEIGVRKVLGASVSGIVTLLGKDFVKLVGIAFFVSVPLAWWAMNTWLEDFAYKIEINPILYVSAGGILLFIALVTVSYQSFKAAVNNPADTLRSE